MFKVPHANEWKKNLGINLDAILYVWDLEHILPFFRATVLLSMKFVLGELFPDNTKHLLGPITYGAPSGHAMVRPYYHVITATWPLLLDELVDHLGLILMKAQMTHGP